MNRVKVLNLSALSFSGTTWLNLLLGSHSDVFALGPPHRVWALRNKNFDGACLIHGRDCEFWSGFDKYWDQRENFFVALADFSGKSIFLMDNAPQDIIDATMNHPSVEILHGYYIRDARAITASYARKMTAKGISYVDSIQPDGWFYPSFMALPSLKELENSGSLVVHYEKAANDQVGFLKKAGEFLDIEYDQAAFRFWEAEHHITSGNQGPIAMIKLHQGVAVGNFEGKETYVSQLQRLKEDPTKAFRDERWQNQLDSKDLFEFDKLMGEKNADRGYQRSHVASKKTKSDQSNGSQNDRLSLLQRLNNFYRNISTKD